MIKRSYCLSKPLKENNYKKDDTGNEVYPKTEQGSEYYLYKGKIPLFAKNNENDEIYAKDSSFNEIYPKHRPFFAKNRNNEFYYAKDCKQNEFYANYKRRDIYTYNKNGDVLIAHSNKGKQIYPKDHHGNEYYLINRENKPFYLKNENGQSYAAKTYKNEFLYLEPPTLNSACIQKQKDFLKNTVYKIQPKKDYLVSLDVFCCLISMTVPLVTVILLFF